ncbi:methylmalonyl-CoA mutase family protein [Streptomyces sp. NBC_00140]|uniref:methylmalonyl-CoA mutase family protein n=1 Tax=Streptomyces sp. NBC_00140 TaxID=2975664 RepID=UPI002254AB8A|nr:methylmalonyl-CoA mutase family protein [Streptomyces sp. NBC_00140]MCX5331778.1 methylmalonyl-CoA mutase family protein [Streptomyces sp. NBC_00140]
MGIPGEFPYDAGLHPGGYTTRLWTMRQLAGLYSAESTNSRFRYLLEMGETGLSLAFDLPTQLGLDPDAPAADGEVGRTGVSVATVDDLKTVFKEIPLDRVSVSFTINATAPMLLAMWIVAAEESDVDPAALRGTLQNEMLKEFLARKAYVYDLDTSVRYALDVVEYCMEHLPGVNPISVSGGHAREAGADAALEVACALASVDAYLAGMVERGHSAERVASRFSFIFGTDMEVLKEAAKLRVARRRYAERMRDRWGVTSPRAMRLRAQVNTFGSALAYQEPLNNIVRATLQAVAAVLGGTQSLHVCSFDEAVQTPGPLGARIALRTQQIIAHETDLARYADPLGGSHVIEGLVDELGKEVDDWLERIEARGGVAACIRSGWLEGQIEELAYRDPGPTVGVLETSPSESERQLLQAELHTTPGGRRDVERPDCEPELTRLRDDALAGRNVLPALIEAVRRRATIGQLCTAMRPADDPSAPSLS